MTTTSDSCPVPDGEDERTAAVRRVESEFMSMVGRFRWLIASRAERLSPGLLPGSFKVFTTIAMEGPITATSVVDQLMLDKSQMSRMVAELEKRDLIVRAPDPNDGRAQLLEATSEARAKLDQVRSHPSEKSMRAKLADWDVADIRKLGLLLHALNNDADADEESPEQES